MVHFSKEDEYRDWVRRDLEVRLVSSQPTYLVLASKTVNDIVVCKENAAEDVALFIEVKYFTATKARLGLGDGKSMGFQPEILARKPRYFERYLRWLIGCERGLAVLVSNDDLRRHAAGGVFREGKQNNIQWSVMEENRPFPLEQSPEAVIKWRESV
jgi:hypothetical protein